VTDVAVKVRRRTGKVEVIVTHGDPKPLHPSLALG
jgi:hypothetical protein